MIGSERKQNVTWRCAVIFLGLTASALGAEPNRLALVIGSSTYPTLPALPSCDASANIVAASLRRAGFAVTDLRNPSNGRMGAAITEFGDALAQGSAGAAVLYACGYAAGLDSRVFLLPASARIERETDVLTQGLIARLAVGAIGAADVQAGLALLDTVVRPGAPAVALDGIALPASTPGKALVAASGTKPPPSGPTPLASTLANALAAPELELKALVADLRASVSASAGTSLAQEPPAPAWLVGGPAAAPPPAPAPVPPAPPAPVAAPPPAPEPAAPPPPAPAPAPPPVAAAAPDTPAALNEADRRRVQFALQRLGYYSGRVDGAFGPESLAAIRRFQHELGAEMTGRLTTEQAQRLLLDSK